MSYTVSSRIAETGTEADHIVVHHELARSILEAWEAEAERLGVKQVMVAECGCDTRSMFFEAQELLGRPFKFPIVLFDAVLLEAIERGTLPVEKTDKAITLHDPCHSTRLAGQGDLMRELLGHCTSDFREMTPNREHNYCCNGGAGGLRLPENTPVRRQVSLFKANQIKHTGADYVTTPCVVCMLTLDDVCKTYHLGKANEGERASTMMFMEAFLNVYAPIAFTVFFVGLMLRMGRWAKALVVHPTARGRNRGFPLMSRDLGLLKGAQAVLVDPVTHFHKRANRTWSRGYLLYHIAIITEVSGYTLSALILLGRILAGQPVPDISRHLERSFNYSPANLLAIVFGNGEHLAAQFLFGSLAPVFVAVTWVAVGFAVVGNLHLVYTLLRRRNGAVVADIDAAAKGVRVKGRLTWDRLAVRLLIFAIIWTELLARLEVVEGIVFVHAALGAMLFTLFPFTYLFHMVFNVVALYYSARRRSIRAIA